MSSEGLLRESTAEFQHKMCKKLAQLTRVIYQLNIQNDDNDSFSRNLVEALQKELESRAQGLQRKFDQALNRLEQVLEDFSTSKADQIERLRQQFETEKSQLIKQLTAIEAKMESHCQNNRTERLLSDKEARLQQSNMLVKSMEESFARAMARLETESRAVREEAKATEAALSARLERELREKEDLKERVRTLEQDLEARARQVEEERIRSFKTHYDLSAGVKEYEERLASLRETNARLEETVRGLSEQLGRRTEAVAELERQRDAWEVESQGLAQAITQREVVVERLEHEIQDLDEQLKDRDNRLAAKRTLLGQQITELDRQKTQLDASARRVRELESQLKLCTSEIEESREMAKIQRQQLTAAINSLKIENDDLRFKDRERQAFMESLKEERADLLNQVGVLQKDLAQQTAMAVEQANAGGGLSEELLRLKGLLNQRETETDELRMQIKESNLLIQTRETEIKKGQNDLAELGQLNELLKRQLAELNTNDSEATILAEQHRQRAETLEVQLSHLTAQRQEMQARVDHLSAQLSAEQIKLARSKTTFATFLRKVHGLKDRLLVNEESNIPLSLKESRLKEVFFSNPQVNGINKKASISGYLNAVSPPKMPAMQLEISVSRVITDITQRLSVIQSKANTVLSNKHVFIDHLHRAFESQSNLQHLENENFLLKSRAKDLEHKALTFSESVDALNKKVSNLRSVCASLKETLEQREAEVRGLKDELSATAVANRQEILELRRSWEARLIDVQQNGDATLRETSKEYRVVIERLESSLKETIGRYEALLTEERGRFKQEADVRAELHRLEVDQLQTDAASNLEQAIAELIKAHQGELGRSTNGYEERIATLEAEKASILKNYGAIITDNKNELFSLKNDIKVLEMNLRAAEGRGKQLELALEDKEHEAIHQARLHEELLKQERELAERRQTILDEQLRTRFEGYKVRFEEEARTALAECRREFEVSRAEHENLSRARQEEASELARLFKLRPSKKEDLQAISQLKRRLAEQASTINDLNEQMKFFRLELVNRERNYNELFNANPLIGVLDPLSQKTVPTLSNLGKEGTARLGQKPQAGPNPPAKPKHTLPTLENLRPSHKAS